MPRSAASNSAAQKGVLQGGALPPSPFAPPWQSAASPGEVRMNPSRSPDALPSHTPALPSRCPPSPGHQLLQTPTLRVPIPRGGLSAWLSCGPRWGGRGTPGHPLPPPAGARGGAGTGSPVHTSNKLLLNNLIPQIVPFSLRFRYTFVIVPLGRRFARTSFIHKRGRGSGSGDDSGAERDRWRGTRPSPVLPALTVAPGQCRHRGDG